MKKPVDPIELSTDCDRSSHMMVEPSAAGVGKRSIGRPVVYGDVSHTNQQFRERAKKFACWRQSSVETRAAAPLVVGD
jgi:hypothetical protein